MKKLFTLVLVCLLLATSTFPVNAITSKEYDTIDITEQISISDKTIKMLSEIPIYFTYINNSNVDDMDFIKESVSLEIDEATKNNSNNLSTNKLNEQLHITKHKYKVIGIEKSSKKDVITNPLYRTTFKRVQELIDQGTKVNYINLFVKEPDITTLSSDPNDPAYWEANCEYLGTYDNYKFLFLESATNVESSWVTPGNIGVSLKWDEIAGKTLEAVLDHYVTGVYYKAVKAVSSALSTFFNFVDTPLSVNYSSAAEGYLKAKVSGTLYIRTILIQDRLDRVSGYAYYDWGMTEEYKSNLKIDVKWPISERPGGTYNYATDTHTFPAEYSWTPGFYGNSTLYSSIISLYENPIGYFTHNEFIDIDSIITELLD